MERKLGRYWCTCFIALCFAAEAKRAAALDDKYPALMIFPGKEIAAEDALELIPIVSKIKAGEVQVQGGEAINERDWDAIFFMLDKKGLPTCTAVAVGPKVILTAAHCVDNGKGKSVPVFAYIAGKSYPLSCTMHTNWVSAQSGFYIKNDADIALCKPEGDVDIPSIKYESIDWKTKIPTGTSVILSGFGCTSIWPDIHGQIEYTVDNKTLHMGRSKLERINFSLNNNKGSMFTTLAKTKEDAALCPGDSGGPLFHESNNIRSVVGINSAVKAVPAGDSFYLRSIFASIGSSSVLHFIKEWKANNSNPTICGYEADKGTLGCK